MELKLDILLENGHSNEMKIPACSRRLSEVFKVVDEVGQLAALVDLIAC